MGTRSHWGIGLSITISAAVLPLSASAQDRLPAATGSSDSAAFRVQGLPVGGFRLYPVLRLSADYDDNVTRSNNHPRGDASFIIAPTLDARSNWSNHELDASGFFRSTNYVTRTSQNHKEYGANATGRLDVRRTTTIDGSLGFARVAEQRGTPGDLFLSQQLILPSTFTGNGSVSQRFNRFRVTAGGGLVRYRFDDDVPTGGTFANQSFRDRSVASVNSQIEYQWSALTSLYISGSYNDTSYDHPVPTLDRSSTGISVLAGAQFQITDLLTGHAGIGYLRQQFSDHRYADFSGLNYDVSLNYRLTELTSVSLKAGRRLTDSVLFQVAGVLTQDVRLSVEHELLRNLLLQGSVGYSSYVYRGLARHDNRFQFSAGARYRISRLASLALSGDRVMQDSGDVQGRKYVSNRGTLSLVLSR